MNKWFECRASGPKSAEVLIYDDIGGWGLTAKDFIKEVKALGNVDELHVRLNSGGGDVFDGFAIYNYLAGHKAVVNVTVDGLAASIASAIAMAGDSISIPSSGFLMIHDPSGFAMGSSSTMRKMGETLDGIKSALVRIYAKRTGIDSSEIESMMSEETWLNGDEAVDKGFATQLIDTPAIAAHIGTLDKFQKVPNTVRKIFAGQASSEVKHMTDQNSEGTQSDQGETPAPVVKKSRRAIVDALAADAPVGATNTPPSEPRDVRTKAERDLERVVDVEREAKRLAAEHGKKMAAAYRSANMLKFTADHVDKLIEDGVEWDDVPEVLIEANARRAQRQTAVGSLIPSGATVGFSNEDPKIILARMTDAISCQFIPGGKPSNGAEQYINWRVQDYMRWCLDSKGFDTRSLTRSQIVDEAMHSVSDFPKLLGASANKIFLGAYTAAPVTFRSISSTQNFSNFQVFNLLRDGDFPTLNRVLETGEFTRGSMSESQETGQLQTYGRIFSISRPALVNDTLAVFGRMTAKIGQAVARFENKTVWAIVSANPLMGDGVALYATAAIPTGHANYTTGVNAISATTLGTGRSKMRVQKSLDGETLNIAPRVLVVPAALETLAEQVLNPLTLTLAESVTPGMRQLQLVVEPLLDGNVNGLVSWYLFADPAVGAAIQYGYLEGDSAPRITTNEPFTQDGISFKVRLDFHAEPVDYRFTYKSLGA